MPLRGSRKYKQQVETCEGQGCTQLLSEDGHTEISHVHPKSPKPLGLTQGYMPSLGN